MWRTAGHKDCLRSAPLTKDVPEEMNKAFLNKDELQELDDFLLQVELEDAMDISTLDGFLTAIVSGPNVIPPSQWMPWVWDMERGEADPVFDDMETARRILDLMMRHMNSIAMTLTYSPEDYQPLLMENPNKGDPVPLLDDWCWGYMAGVRLDAAAWRPVMEDHAEWMSTITLYGTEKGWDTLARNEPSLDEHRALAAALADDVRRIHAFWLRKRTPTQTTRAQPGSARATASSAEKVGRNTLCPCGSGKKYKRCHGSPERLH